MVILCDSKFFNKFRNMYIFIFVRWYGKIQTFCQPNMHTFLVELAVKYLLLCH